jgi:hypothetical protein
MFGLPWAWLAPLSRSPACALLLLKRLPPGNSSTAAHLGKARRTILYWSKEDGFEPQGGWTDVFVSLLSAVNDALQDTIIKKQRLIEFKRSYSGAGR